MKWDGHILLLQKTASALIMMLALLWLTVSTPFVYAANQAVKKELNKTTSFDENNPFSNTTEEKNESNPNTISEYLTELFEAEHQYTLVQKSYKCHPSHLYFEYHPQLVLPPPKA